MLLIFPNFIIMKVMKITYYIIILIFSTIITWINWIFIITMIDPDTASIFDYILFYLSLFFALMGIIIFSGLLVHAKVSQKYSIQRRIQLSTRHGILLAFFLVGSLWLQSFRLLNWINIFLFILILTIIEFFFITKKRSLRSIQNPF